MEIQINEVLKIGDEYFGFHIWQVEASYKQNHTRISLYPVQLEVVYIYPLEQLQIQIRLFFKLSIKIGIGVGNAQ